MTIEWQIPRGDKRSLNSGWRWKGRGLAAICLALVAFLAADGAAFATTFTTLDPPGSTATQALGISGDNVVGGYSVGSALPQPGFVYNRATSTWTNLNIPSGVDWTSPSGIDGNNIVGNYRDTSTYVVHGFVYNGSTFSTLDHPLAPTSGTNVGTSLTGISGNSIVGWYNESNENADIHGGPFHGFLYDGSSFAAIADPFAGSGGTSPLGIDGNNIVGSYYDSSGASHGFLYNGSTYATLDVPFAGSTDTYAAGISGNNISGGYLDSSGVAHGFLYNGSTYTTLDVPSAGSSSGQGAWAAGISGTSIVGFFVDTDDVVHGFLAEVPEPSSIVILSLGAMGLAVAALRRGRNRTRFSRLFAVGAGISWRSMAGRKFVNHAQWLRIAVAAACALSATHLMATTYNAVADFSAGDNPSGAWSYHYATSLGGSLTSLIAEPLVSSSPHVDAFGTYVSFPDDVQVFRNLGPGSWNFLTIVAPTDLLTIDPQGDVADIRWTAPATAEYSVSGLFEGVDTHGANHQYLVLRDYDTGSSFFSPGNAVYGVPIPFSFSASFTAGETIDFIVNGAGGGAYEAAGLSATISSVPEPSSVVLCALGFFGLLVMGRRRAKRE